eukprot:TRINITY_DN1280_c0_g1_i1.p1 TRINITY_DN1280_c0_g1~~TRINITY_DN1280_c0_g1_i1.p1  ORF type:complete len:299 (+),score=56.12 TRINITY_DN1280_c0_g1_i1:102-998(+)
MLRGYLLNGLAQIKHSAPTLTHVRRYCSTTHQFMNVEKGNDGNGNANNESNKDQTPSEGGEGSSASTPTLGERKYLGRLPPASPTLKVLYKSPEYAIINKPYDVRIDGEAHEHTIEKMLRKEFPENEKFWWVHQLDYATSGVLCVGLTKKATAKASALFRERQTEKTYLALLHGVVPQGVHTVDHPIADDPQSDFKMMPGTDEVPGRSAVTKIEVLSYGKYNSKDVTKVALHPVTGRRHQLRIHTLLFGHPIVGDATYTDDLETPRMMLHAWRLLLPFKTGEIEIQTEDPFENIMDKE